MTSRHIPAELLIQIARHLTPDIDGSPKARRLAKRTLSNFSLASRACCAVARPFIFNSLHTSCHSWLATTKAMKRANAQHLLSHVKFLNVHDVPHVSGATDCQAEQLLQTSIVKSFLFDLENLEVLLLKRSRRSGNLRIEIEAGRVHHSVVREPSAADVCVCLMILVGVLFLVVVLIFMWAFPDPEPRMYAFPKASRARAEDESPEDRAWRLKVDQATSEYFEQILALLRSSSENSGTGRVQELPRYQPDGVFA